ncbi:MAG: hypothetical protein ACRC67_30880 [Inquilinus sp.]|uniref:hypothetical protein n=1 Tax=Inquilinus sp. TaxID=1932117 RepID=UPI003F345F84
MKVWITKYALTRGIQEVEAEHRGDDVVLPKGNGFWGVIAKPHWHETREAAVARAEAMRKKRINTLKKQIARLAKMEF